MKERLINENKGKSILWLQKTLIECCYVKLYLKNNKDVVDQFLSPVIMEPVPYHYTRKLTDSNIQYTKTYWFYITLVLQ